MRVIQPYTEILTPITGYELPFIERIGRVCYKSEDRICEGSAEKFVKMLIDRGHEAMLEHSILSVLFVCDRGVSHELVRHRFTSLAQESTRYCNYTSKKKFSDGLTFIKPCFFKENSKKYRIWYALMGEAEVRYNSYINTYNLTPQEARDILPHSLKTELVITANYREWRNIFKLRTDSNAHPQVRELMVPLLRRLQGLIPVVFDDILPSEEEFA